MELPVHNINGEVVGKAELSDHVYAAPPNPTLLHQAMVYHQANQRQGTHSTKTRAAVSGGGRKPFAQKGTGRARMGTIRSPLARHGGITFGPHPRSYRQRLPKKMRRQAIRCALSAKVQGARLVLLEDMELPDAKTKTMAAVLSALDVRSPTLVVVASPTPNVSFAVRNLPRVKTLTADLLNVLDLLRYDRVVMTMDAARRSEALWSAVHAETAAEKA